MKLVTRLKLLPLIVGLATASTPPLAQAQSADNRAPSTATAEALFEQGREALRVGDLNKACALLEGSQRVDAAIGTQLLLAHCYEQLGRTASAWALFREVASLSGDSVKRGQIAQIRADALAGRLARLILRVDTQDQKLLSEVYIRRDDVELPSSAIGIAVPVDPGTHTFEIYGPGIETWSSSVEVPAGPTTVTVLASGLKIRKRSLPPGGSGDKLPATLDSSQPAQPVAEYTLSPWPWIWTAAGVLGVAAGTTLAITASNTYGDSKRHCRTAMLCSAEGLTLRDSAGTQANVATGAFVFGGASLALAGILFLTRGPAPRDESRLQVGLDASQSFAGLRVAGEF
jgi:hypothetical protein